MILDRIVAEKEREVARLRAPRASLFKALGECGISVIAEIKKASPSKGVIVGDFDHLRQMESYVRGGAAAVSVLTDPVFFKGSGAILRDLSGRAGLPLLRKDFLIDPLQVEESYFLGADAVLLIAAILEGPKLKEMLERVHSLRMEALVEVHDEVELYRALETSARVIGINNRSLKDFTVDLKTSERLIAEMERLGARSGNQVVAESGITSRADVVRLEEAGADAILVGESLMRSSDPAGLIAELKGGKKA
ncbi:MAG: indole-3-glycerol phosphate synthase TrpC [Thermovirgaceae bacterium]|nr:indole-3-glycerol phosphate synthase TrpC [Thermovirgaceae bacterium]